MTILYPKSDDATFDMDYYTSTHMPMVAKAISADSWGAMSVNTDKHVAMGWLLFESMDTYNAGMAAQGTEIRADVANYTNQQPEVLMGEVTGGG